MKKLLLVTKDQTNHVIHRITLKKFKDEKDTYLITNYQEILEPYEYLCHHNDIKHNDFRTFH